MRVLTGRNLARLGAVAIACVSAAALAGAPVSASPTAPSSDKTAESTGIGLSQAAKNRLLRGAVKSTKDGRVTPGIFSPAFAPAPLSTRVVGGELANAADYPWIVGIETTFAFDEDEPGAVGYGSIEDDEWWTSYCTGTALSSNKILTAGHCHVGFPLASTVVIAGRNNLDDNTSGGAVIQVASTWTHQSFNYKNISYTVMPKDDVAVLTLASPLPVAYTPIALSDQGDPTPYAEGTNALIIGYGRNTNTSSSTLGVLHKATVPIKSDATCTTAYGSQFVATKEFCAGDPTVLPEGRDTCGGDSGGPVVVAGKQIGITDWGSEVCGSSYGVYERISYYRNSIDTDVARVAAPNLDWTGNGHSDLLTRNSSGYLVQFDGSGFGNDGMGAFTSPWASGGGTVIDTGWSTYTKLFRVNNWTGDNKPAIMGRDSVGRLFLHKSDGFGNFTGSRIQVGTGWNTFTDIMVTNNWTGNLRPNLMGRKSNGELYIYTSNGAGGWENDGTGIKIGTGWNSFNTVLTPGNWRGRGPALIGRTPGGELKLYESDTRGGWLNDATGIKIGTGWQVFKTFMSPGDINGDNMVDLIGIDGYGKMRMYNTSGDGKWLNDGTGTYIGTRTNWTRYNQIF